MTRRSRQYYVAIILVTLMTESFEQHTFSNRVYDGTLSHDLLRPQPVVLGVIGENLAIRGWLTLLGAPIVLVTAFAMDTTGSAGDPCCWRCPGSRWPRY